MILGKSYEFACKSGVPQRVPEIQGRRLEPGSQEVLSKYYFLSLRPQPPGTTPTITCLVPGQPALKGTRDWSFKSWSLIQGADGSAWEFWGSCPFQGFLEEGGHELPSKNEEALTVVWVSACASD